MSNYTGHISIHRAARLTGGYRVLVRNLCIVHGIEIDADGSTEFVKEEDLPRIRALVAQWKERPRLAGPVPVPRGGWGGGARGPLAPPASPAFGE